VHAVRAVLVADHVLELDIEEAGGGLDADAVAAVAGADDGDRLVLTLPRGAAAARRPRPVGAAVARRDVAVDDPLRVQVVEAVAEVIRGIEVFAADLAHVGGEDAVAAEPADAPAARAVPAAHVEA
jgi:hypothetical protein